MSFKHQDHFSGHADRYEEYPKRISLPPGEILRKTDCDVASACTVRPRSSG